MPLIYEASKVRTGKACKVKDYVLCFACFDYYAKQSNQGPLRVFAYRTRQEASDIFLIYIIFLQFTIQFLASLALQSKQSIPLPSGHGKVRMGKGHAKAYSEAKKPFDAPMRSNKIIEFLL